MSQIRLREYQDASIAALMEHWQSGGGNGLIDLATGLGKSVVIAKLIKDLLSGYPSMRILMLVDSPELVEQNFLELIRLWPQAPAGIYAAKLGRKDAHHQITFAMIQSVHRRAADLGPRQLVLIDEVHMVPHEGEGMYRRLLAAMEEMEPNMRVGGLTATPFRMKGGSLVGSDGAIFDKIVFSYGLGQAIEDGWLTPLVGRPGSSEVDVSKIERSGGEFTDGGLQRAFDKSEITDAAIDDMERYADGRGGWLVFCAGVEHAQNVAAALTRRGHRAEAIWGDMDAGARKHIIAGFKAGRVDALVSVGVLTKGFNAVVVRLIAFLFASLSPGKIIQIAGRGTRTIYPTGFSPDDATGAERRRAIAEGPKPDCMILDFAGNLRRHGPIDLITIGPKVKKGEKDPNAVKVDTVRGKECPNCKGIQALNALVCRDCDYEFPIVDKPDHAAEAEDVAILARDLPKVSLIDEVPVMGWRAVTHEKFGMTPSMKVLYSAGLVEYPEWQTFEHIGHARDKSRRWWSQHGGFDPPPKTTAEAIARFGELRRPAFITTKKNGKWFDITGRRFALSQEDAA